MGMATFGKALEALKAGKKVTRSGWNGKGMYLWLLPAAAIPADWGFEPHLKEIAESDPSKPIDFLGSIRMRTQDGKVLTGWLASQTDMLLEDWLILADESKAETEPEPETEVDESPAMPRNAIL